MVLTGAYCKAGIYSLTVALVSLFDPLVRSPNLVPQGSLALTEASGPNSYKISVTRKDRMKSRSAGELPWDLMRHWTAWPATSPALQVLSGPKCPAAPGGERFVETYYLLTHSRGPWLEQVHHHLTLLH